MSEATKLIEENLSKLKLWANSIPEQTSQVNLWHLLSEKDWDIIRTVIYKRDNYRCHICGKGSVQIHAHEQWKFDYSKELQILEDIISLCTPCHYNVHLGYSGGFEKSEREIVITHWCNINQKSREAFNAYVLNVFALSTLKEKKFKWTVVLKSNKEILKGVTLKDVFFSLGLKIDMNKVQPDKNNEPLTQIHGIGPQIAKKLIEQNVSTLSDLLEYDDLCELAKFSSISVSQLECFKQKAKSLTNGHIYQIGSFRIPEGPKIYFDIETDINQEKIWLIGLQIEGKIHQLYADNWEQEKEILVNFLDLLKKNPKTILISYSGTNFDFIVIQKALKRHKLDISLFTAHKHIDLFILIRRSFIFPLPKYKLKILGKYLGYSFRHSEIDGFYVTMEYQNHIDTGKPFNQDYIEYNDDDVKALPYIISSLQSNKDILHRESRQENDAITPFDANININILILKIRNFYEQSGNGRLSIRPDKRSNHIKAEIRMFGKELSDLKFIRRAMMTLSFREGNPIKDKNRYYIPYYGKDQVKKFLERVKPRVKNDISLL